MRFHQSLSAVTIAVFALASSACQREDPRIASLQVGMIKDSVNAVMGVSNSPPAAYLMGGQYIEVMMFRSDGETGPIEGLGRKSILPVVIVDGALTGWGWQHLDSVAEIHHIPADPAQ